METRSREAWVENHSHDGVKRGNEKRSRGFDFVGEPSESELIGA